MGSPQNVCVQSPDDVDACSDAIVAYCNAVHETSNATSWAQSGCSIDCILDDDYICWSCANGLDSCTVDVLRVYCEANSFEAAGCEQLQAVCPFGGDLGLEVVSPCSDQSVCSQSPVNIQNCSDAIVAYCDAVLQTDDLDLILQSGCVDENFTLPCIFDDADLCQSCRDHWDNCTDQIVEYCEVSNYTAAACDQLTIECPFGDDLGLPGVVSPCDICSQSPVDIRNCSDAIVAYCEAAHQTGDADLIEQSGCPSTDTSSSDCIFDDD